MAEMAGKDEEAMEALKREAVDLVTCFYGTLLFTYLYSVITDFSSVEVCSVIFDYWNSVLILVFCRKIYQ